MAIAHVERIICDNPDYAVYVEELIREEPGRHGHVEYVQAQAVLQVGARGESSISVPRTDAPVPSIDDGDGSANADAPGWLMNLNQSMAVAGAEGHTF